jgi:hypothetical protein
VSQTEFPPDNDTVSPLGTITAVQSRVSVIGFSVVILGNRLSS